MGWRDTIRDVDPAELRKEGGSWRDTIRDVGPEETAAPVPEAARAAAPEVSEDDRALLSLGLTPEQVATYNQSIDKRTDLEKGLSYAKSAGLGGLQGVSYGLADEIEAGVRATAGKRTYADLLKEVRERYAKAKEENPNTFMAGDVAGSLASPSFGLGGIKTAGQLFKAGGATGKQLLAAMGKTALREGAEGALSSVGRAESPLLSEETAKEAMTGAALGAGLSTAGSVLGLGVRKGQKMLGESAEAGAVEYGLKKKAAREAAAVGKAKRGDYSEAEKAVAARVLGRELPDDVKAAVDMALGKGASAKLPATGGIKSASGVLREVAPTKEVVGQAIGALTDKATHQFDPRGLMKSLDDLVAESAYRPAFQKQAKRIRRELQTALIPDTPGEGARPATIKDVWTLRKSIDNDLPDTVPDWKEKNQALAEVRNLLENEISGQFSAADPVLAAAYSKLKPAYSALAKAEQGAAAEAARGADLLAPVTLGMTAAMGTGNLLPENYRAFGLPAGALLSLASARHSITPSSKVVIARVMDRLANRQLPPGVGKKLADRLVIQGPNAFLAMAKGVLDKTEDQRGEPGSSPD